MEEKLDTTTSVWLYISQLDIWTPCVPTVPLLDNAKKHMLTGPRRRTQHCSKESETGDHSRAHQQENGLINCGISMQENNENEDTPIDAGTQMNLRDIEMTRRSQIQEVVL